MKYSKPAISIDVQIKKLKDRGLLFNDEVRAADYLSNISYYRLRAYTYPFQDNTSPNHPFIAKISFEDIINLYVFDRKLRLLIFDAMEKVEVALRTQIIYQYSLAHGSHWHTDPANYRNPMSFVGQMTDLNKEINRGAETFITHYQETYTSPAEPPCWMSLELSSMSLLSRIYQNLKLSAQKDAVANHFGMMNIRIFENWLFCFCNLRNICAHHGRIWNRRLVKITLPYNTPNPFLQNSNVYTNKLYATVACLQYVLNIISPGSNFKNRLKDLMANCPLQQEKEMGFPNKWENDPFWNL